MDWSKCEIRRTRTKFQMGDKESAVQTRARLPPVKSATAIFTRDGAEVLRVPGTKEEGSWWCFPLEGKLEAGVQYGYEVEVEYADAEVIVDGVANAPTYQEAFYAGQWPALDDDLS